MFGRLLCLIGWHDWGYRRTRHLVRHMNTAWDTEYRCLRCGEQP